MAKNDFPSTKPAESYPLGHAKENKDASVYSGFKYPVGGGNDIGVYKQPMGNPNGTGMDGVDTRKDPNRMKSQEVEINTPAMRVSVGDPGNARQNKHGEKTMRGYGAATKGIKTRGPMA